MTKQLTTRTEELRAEFVNEAARQFCEENDIEYTDESDEDNDIEFDIECSGVRGSKLQGWSLRRTNALKRAAEQAPSIWCAEEKAKLEAMSR